TVPLLESEGRYLAEKVNATHPIPHFRRSGMDGFAVQSKDFTKASEDEPAFFLEVLEEIACGQVPKKDIQPGTCSRIMTGAAVPDGADAVIKLEDTKTVANDNKTRIKIEQPVAPGAN